MADELARHERDVPRGGIVFVIVEEPRAVGKMRPLHAQRGGAAVHPLDKDLLGAAQVLRHRHGAVVGRDHGDAFEHLVDAHLLALLEIDAAPAERGRAGAGRDDVVERELAAFNILDDQQQRHHLCDARGHGTLVCALFIQELARLLFHQHGVWRGDFQIVVAQRLGRDLRQGQQKQRRQKTQHAFHPLITSFMDMPGGRGACEVDRIMHNSTKVGRDYSVGKKMNSL